LKTNITILVFFLAAIINAQQFTRMINQPPVTDGGDSRSVNWIDYDGDGDLDLFITNGPQSGQNNFLYENNNGTFTKITDNIITQDVKSSDGSTWGDYDNDRDPDLFVGNWWGQNNLLYNNAGNKSFILTNEKPSLEPSYSETGSWGDFNNDGFLDLYVANSDGNRKNFLYMNNGDGRFTKILEGDIVNDAHFTRSVDWIDYDNDGDLDLYCANEGNTQNSLYKNNGDNTFTKITNLPIVLFGFNSLSSSWADFDNDGDFDLFIANNSNQNNEFYRNNGDENFSKLNLIPVTNDNGYSVSNAWGDVDNDGDLDLFVTNAFSGNARTNNFFYINNGNGTFTKDNGLLTQNNGWTYGAEFGDFNGDGYLDLATANCFGANENNSVYVNTGGTNNWIILDLEGNVSNKSAIGTVVKLKANISGNNILQSRRVAGQSSYCAQNLQLHFGLGTATVVDSLFIYWASGETTVLTNVSPNQKLKIIENFPDGFLKSNFKADVLSGGGGLKVQFTDLSISDSNIPITNWEWDFNNDGTVDSHERNPEYTFTSSSASVFSVKLNVGNGNTTSEKLRENYIQLSGVTSINKSELPSGFILNQNYPNPFNPSTKIKFNIPNVVTHHAASLQVYDILGNKIKTILNKKLSPGEYEIEFNGNGLNSGVYFYTLEVGGLIQTKKMILIK